MRLRLAYIALVGGALVACNNNPKPTTQTQIIEGNVYQTARTGGNALVGAQVSATYGTATQTVTTGANGHFRLELKGSGTTFDLTVAPPAGSGLVAVTYDDVPLADYNSQYGAAGEMNIYLGGGPQGALPGFAAKFGCIAGKLLDGGAPAANTSGGRSSITACGATSVTTIATDPNTTLNTGPQPGEDGLVVWGGSRTVPTAADGSYLLPIRTTNNGFAFEGNIWAGNYTGSDNPDLAKATEVYWSKFAFVPQAKVYMNPNGTVVNQPDLSLQAFDPASNPNVASLTVTHDASALTGFDFSATGTAFSVSIPSFESSVTSAELELGQYYLTGSGSKSMRVYKVPAGKQGQTLTTLSRAIKLTADGKAIDAFSNATAWRNGTNATTPITAQFLGIASPQSPAAAATGVATKPTLTWKAVPGAVIYIVAVYNPSTGAAIWTGFTPNTSITLPLGLAANTQYAWDVYTDDQTAFVDYIGVAPEALQAARYLDVSHLARLGGLGQGSKLNAWRGALARNYLNSLGYVPKIYATREGAYQNLISKGYRESNSETLLFTTGN